MILSLKSALARLESACIMMPNGNNIAFLILNFIDCGMPTGADDTIVSKLRSTLMEMKVLNQLKVKTTAQHAAPFGVAIISEREYQGKRKLDRRKENRDNIENDLRVELIKRIQMNKKNRSRQFNGLEINRIVMQPNGPTRHPQTQRPSHQRRILSLRKDNLPDQDHKEDSMLWDAGRLKTESYRDVSERPCTAAYTQHYRWGQSKHKLNSV